MRLPCAAEFFGGAEFATRKIARFSPLSAEYNAAYPVSVIEIAPSSKTFAHAVTHRDFLGAIMNLGIDRGKTGDIFVENNVGFLVVKYELAAFIAQNLQKVGANTVRCNILESLPESLAPKTEKLNVNVASPRIDAIICRTFNLPRETGSKLVSLGKVFINGKECNSNAYSPKENDTIAVRGYGKFVFRGINGTSSKGRTFVCIEIYK